MLTQCSDAKPYTNDHPPPSDKYIRDLVLRGHKTFSGRMEKNIGRIFCHHWETTALGAKKSRYNGTFELQDGRLELPILILSLVSSLLIRAYQAHNITEQKYPRSCFTTGERNASKPTPRGQCSTCSADRWIWPRHSQPSFGLYCRDHSGVHARRKSAKEKAYRLQSQSPAVLDGHIQHHDVAPDAPSSASSPTSVGRVCIIVLELLNTSHCYSLVATETNLVHMSYTSVNLVYPRSVTS